MAGLLLKELKIRGLVIEKEDRGFDLIMILSLIFELLRIIEN